jgi:DNA polymerase-3 subunit alpha
VHTHTKFSYNDALPTVEDVVARAVELGYRGLGLQDHGNMGGTIQLYSACKKAGIKAFPGTELYLVKDRMEKTSKRYHAGVLAFSNEGYRNLVRMNTRAAQQFYNKPILDLADLAEMSEAGALEGIALTTGCFFGMVIQTLLGDGYDAAKNLVGAFAAWFPVVYVEAQSHGIEHDEGLTEEQISESLARIAEELSLPMVITQDSHYTHPEHRVAHDTLKRLVGWGLDPDSAVFPGDGYHMVDDAWMQTHHSAEIYDRGIAGLEDLLERHSLTIPELDDYEYMVPFTVADPQAELKKRCLVALDGRGLMKNAYLDRLEHELDIVDFTRMAGYLLLVSEVTDYCTSTHIFFQARGSASGSLICWLLGITSVDPLKWGLLVERFLAKDRTKPPDVDLDIEHNRRAELVAWLGERFSVSQIGTWSKYSLSGDEGGKGSLRVRYLSSRRKQGLTTEWEEITDDDRKKLYELSDFGPFALVGTHAAGLLLTTTRDQLEDLVPMMYIASSKTMVSQYDMKDVEKLGLVKLDVLGLKTLTVLRLTVQNLGRDVADGLDFIPLSDSATLRTISRGDTAGVFQLEGAATARGSRELKPESVKDVIASMALFRPATMQSGATASYIARKHKREDTPKRHAIIDKHTKATHGILLYQEQVIAVLRDLGLDPDELTRFLKAVKASNGDIGNASGVIHEMMVHIIELCVQAEMTQSDITWLNEALNAYSGYGFNQAHATVYGLTAYRCAWLVTHAATEFHAALLAVAAGSDKEPEYLRAARNRGVRILPPDVNYSGASYRVDTSRQGSVRKGLTGIKGIGDVAAMAIEAAQPFHSLKHFSTSVDPRKVTGVKAMPTDIDTMQAAHEEDLVGIVRKLSAAGAFRSLMKEE